MISQAVSPILSNKEIASGHFRLRFKRPAGFRSVKPGQFLQIRVTAASDPFLPRPLCVYDYGAGWVEVVYQAAGRGTDLLSRKAPGESLGVLGPLGNGFPLQTTGDLYVFVAGGVGIASLYLTAKAMVKKRKGKSRPRYVLLFGSQSRKTLHCQEDFKRLGFEIQIATNDGSSGFKGYVTDLIQPLFKKYKPEEPWVYSCGPRPMFHALNRRLSTLGRDAFLSMDENMACGVGVCLGCAVRLDKGAEKSYGLVCRQGPVFKMSELDWSL